MKYYRTYIIQFETSSGIMYYAGKRESKFKNPEDDPYTGSGVVIKRAIKKYGRSCVRNIEWFCHKTREETNIAEVELIGKLRECHGSSCCNIARGGSGNSMEYATDEEIRDWKNKISRTKNTSEHKKAASETQKRIKNTPEAKAKNSQISQDRWKDAEYKKRVALKIKESVSTDEVRNKKRTAISNLMAEGPEYSRRISDGVKKAKRNGPVWDYYEKGELYSLWEDLGFPAYKKFSSILRRNGILAECTQYQFSKPVKQMVEDRIKNEGA